MIVYLTTRTMTHINSVGYLCETTNLWFVEKKEKIECPVCFEEHGIEKFTMCGEGHLLHEKCLLQQVKAGYSLGQSFNDEGNSPQTCSVCRSYIADHNCSTKYLDLLPMFIFKGMTNNMPKETQREYLQEVVEVCNNEERRMETREKSLSRAYIEDTVYDMIKINEGNIRDYRYYSKEKVALMPFAMAMEDGVWEKVCESMDMPTVNIKKIKKELLGKV